MAAAPAQPPPSAPDRAWPATAADRPEALLERVQDLHARLDEAPEATVRAVAEELVTAVVQMYGAGLQRIMAGLYAGGKVGERVAGTVADDPLVATLLLIHDLHPVPLEERVLAALASVRPYMESHGGDVELLALEGGIVRLRLRGSCSGCAASSATLELAIKQALEERAPDLAGLEVEGVAPAASGRPLPMAEISRPPGAGGHRLSPASGGGAELPVIAAPGAPSVAWRPLEIEAEPPVGGLRPVTVAGAALVLANVEGSLLAYRDICAGCGGPLHDGELAGGALRCRHCGRSFWPARAGRSGDGEPLQLAPVPLLRGADGVRVAL